jgi:hypothetical protein
MLEEQVVGAVLAGLSAVPVSQGVVLSDLRRRTLQPFAAQIGVQAVNSAILLLLACQVVKVSNSPLARRVELKLQGQRMPAFVDDLAKGFFLGLVFGQKQPVSVSAMRLRVGQLWPGDVQVLKLYACVEFFQRDPRLQCLAAGGDVEQWHFSPRGQYRVN